MPFTRRLHLGYLKRHEFLLRRESGLRPSVRVSDKRMLYCSGTLHCTRSCVVADRTSRYDLTSDPTNQDEIVRCGYNTATGEVFVQDYSNALCPDNVSKSTHSTSALRGQYAPAQSAPPSLTPRPPLTIRHVHRRPWLVVEPRTKIPTSTSSGAFGAAGAFP